MDSFELTLHRLAAQLSTMLDPVALALARLALLLRSDLDAIGFPSAAQSPLLTGLWMLALAITLLTLTGWTRLITLLAAAPVLAKMYGMLPGG